MSGYDFDILDWSRRQSELLRRLANGERVNEAIDWPNVIEEIEAVGRSQLSTVRSLLIQALLHMMKAQAWPNSLAVPSWRAEAIRFRQDAAEAYAPSMRQHLDVAGLYAKALRAMPAAIDGQPPSPVSPACPLTLDELLALD